MSQDASVLNEDEVKCDGGWSQQAKGGGGKAVVLAINQNLLCA